MEYPVKEYKFAIYPCQKTEGPPAAEVRMEVSCDSDKFIHSFVIWLASFEELYPEFDSKFQIYDETDGRPIHFGDCRCSVEEVILSLLYCCNDPGVVLKELSFQGSRYTDIENFQFFDGSAWEADSEVLTYPVQFQAKKDGSDTRVYLFGPYIRPYYYEPAGETVGALEMTDRLFQLWSKGNFVKSLFYPLSRGTVEVDGKRMYYAERSFFDILVENDDEETGIMEYLNYSEDVEIFLETEGTNLTFSVLLGGKLYPKITKTDDQIVFHYTPFTEEKLAFFQPGDDPRDVVFKKADGAYRYTIENKKLETSRFKGVVFDPPKQPAPESMDEALAGELFREYIRSLYEAFTGADEVKADGYLFRAGTARQREFDAPGLFCTEADGLDVTVTLDLPTAPSGLREYWEFEQHTGAKVRSVSFIEAGMEVSLIPGGSDLTIETLVSEFDEGHRQSFNELKKEGFFSRAGLPETLYFHAMFSNFLGEIDTYTAIKKAICRYGVSKFDYRAEKKKAEQRPGGEGAGSKPKKREVKILTRDEMRRALYEDDKVPDENVVSFAMEMQNEFVRTGRIPNLAMIGEAGIGKTDLAKGFARAVFGKGIKTVTPADLKAPYIGQTKHETNCRLVQAMGNEQIFFIDEVYTLMQDSFGREAVTLLLPLLTGDENVKSLSSRLHEESLTIDFETGKVSGSAYIMGDDGDRITQVEPGFPAIWIAGYEDDVRLMLKENQGLYRRFKRMVLTSPTTDKLFDKLTGSLEAELNKLSEERYEKLKLLKAYPNLAEEIGDDLERKLSILLAQCKDYKEPILKFFRWGTQPQNSKYFANYAGVDIFIDRCLDGIDFTQPADEIKRQIDRVISETKRDIKRQLDTVRRKGNQNQSGNAEAGEQVEMIVDNKTRFCDLVGCDNQVEEMRKIVDMLLKKGEYERFGITVPKGALLEGLPGVGKTFIARAMAGELQEAFEKVDRNKRVGFMSLSAPELTSKPVSFISSVFDKAEEYDVCVIFIDEVDAIAKQRFQNPYYSHLIELIKQMDGVEQRSNVFVLAATNAPEALDPAFTRSGRIDMKLEFRLPDEKALVELTRRGIIKRCGSIENFKIDVNPDQADGVKKLAEKIAKNLDGRGCTAGDVENIVNTAFVMYVKELDDSKPKNKESKPKYRKRLDPSIPAFESGKSENRELRYLYRHLYEASEQHFMGAPGQLDRKESFSVEQNNESRASTAVHEVGHALVKILSGIAPFEKITCLPRGDALGYVTHGQAELYTKADYQNRIRSAMGGRVAEEIVYGRDNISPGASQDMISATHIARLMVERWGFADEFEFMALRETTARYLGGSEYNCSDAFRARVDQAVSELLKQMYQETKGMLADKRELIIALAKEVFNRKTMTGEDFKKFYDKCKK